jgi:hypothetical protein|tara:strand:+ start:1962 stop:2174 length:213 start_codon:yes stop_codon:yes gene_type:complete
LDLYEESVRRLLASKRPFHQVECIRRIDGERSNAEKREFGEAAKLAEESMNYISKIHLARKLQRNLLHQM